MKKEYRSLDTNGVEWREVSGTMGMVFEKLFNVDSNTGAITHLLKFLPGYDSEDELEHDFWEEVFYLEGELREKKRGLTLKGEMYECIPPHTKHGPYATKTGCLAFEVRYH